MKKIFILIIIIAIAILGYTYYKSKNSPGGIGPDSILYPVDNFIEWAQLQLTFNENKKLELQFSFMQERLDELKNLESLKQVVGSENVELLKSKYQELTKNITEEIRQTAKDTINNQADKWLEELRNKEREFLNETIGK